MSKLRSPAGYFLKSHVVECYSYTTPNLFIFTRCFFVHSSGLLNFKWSFNRTLFEDGVEAPKASSPFAFRNGSSSNSPELEGLLLKVLGENGRKGIEELKNHGSLVELVGAAMGRIM